MFMFSPILAINAVKASFTVTFSSAMYFASNNSSTSLTSEVAICFAIEFVNSTNDSLIETKSVSQLTSKATAVLLSSLK